MNQVKTDELTKKIHKLNESCDAQTSRFEGCGAAKREKVNKIKDAVSKLPSLRVAPLCNVKKLRFKSALWHWLVKAVMLMREDFG